MDLERVFRATLRDCRKTYQDAIAKSIKHQRIYRDATTLPLDPKSKTTSDLDLQVIWGDSYVVAEQMLGVLPPGASLPCVLNMASDRHAGGGVRKGARAQEEELCRRSTLYPCLETLDKYYPWPSPHTTVITPGVAVFRAPDTYDYLAKAFAVHVVSAAAKRMSYSEWTKDGTFKDADYKETLGRITALLKTCVYHNQRNLVLGAWGCGAFGNPPKGVALAFRRLLTSEFAGCFDRVWFAIIGGERTRNFETFESILLK